jgi:predicted permease
MAMQPEMMGGSRLEARGNAWMQMWARLRPGATEEQAQAEASALLAQIAQEHPGYFDGWRVSVLPPWRATWGAPSALAPILGVLSVVGSLVLLIACANVANLLLARAVGRRREIAVRLSLGANRLRLMRQLMCEAMLLAVTAGAVGLAIAYGTYGLLMAFVPPTDIPFAFGLRIDATTVLYAVIASVATGVVFGLAPALQASRADTINAIKEEAGRGASGGRSGQRLRNALVVVQVAVCLVLLVGATLFVRSLQAAQHLDPGFEPREMLIASVDLVPNGYTADTGRQFHRRLAEAVSGLPGIDAFALGRRVPLGIGGSSSMGVTVDGYTPRADEEVVILYNVVGPRYFETMKIDVVAGREFEPQDTRDSRLALIVNETMAARYWAGRDAVGGRVRMGEDDYEVVGVARDSKYSRINEAPLPFMYLAFEQNFVSAAVLHVRSTTPAGTLLPAIREVVRTLDPNLPIFDARTMDEHLRGGVFAQRMGANLLGLMGILAVVLAAIGLYGVGVEMVFMLLCPSRELGPVGAVSPGGDSRVVCVRGTPGRRVRRRPSDARASCATTGVVAWRSVGDSVTIPSGGTAEPILPVETRRESDLKAARKVTVRSVPSRSGGGWGERRGRVRRLNTMASACREPYRKDARWLSSHEASGVDGVTPTRPGSHRASTSPTTSRCSPPGRPPAPRSPTGRSPSAGRSTSRGPGRGTS